MAYYDSKHNDTMEAGLLSTHEEEERMLLKEALYQDEDPETYMEPAPKNSTCKRILMALGICFLVGIAAVSIGSATGVCPGHMRHASPTQVSVKDAVHRHNPNLSHAMGYMAKRQNTPISSETRASETQQATEPTSSKAEPSTVESVESISNPSTDEQTTQAQETTSEAAATTQAAATTSAESETQATTAEPQSTEESDSSTDSGTFTTEEAPSETSSSPSESSSEASEASEPASTSSSRPAQSTSLSDNASSTSLPSSETTEGTTDSDSLTSTDSEESESSATVAASTSSMWDMISDPRLNPEPRIWIRTSKIVEMFSICLLMFKVSPCSFANSFSGDQTTSEPTQATITEGTKTTSSAVAKTLTSTRSDGGVVTFTSTSWVAVVPSSKATTTSNPDLQNAAPQFSGHSALTAAIGMIFGGLLLL